jgi:hypothetical protein
MEQDKSLELQTVKLALSLYLDGCGSMKRRVIEMIEARGHSLVTAQHDTTFEFTKEENLTAKGDCILAVRASKGARDLSEEFKRLATRNGSRIVIMISVDGVTETAEGRGCASLTFAHETDIVARRSLFTCGRTAMIRSSKAAGDFSRALIRKLAKPSAIVQITMVAEF